MSAILSPQVPAAVPPEQMAAAGLRAFAAIAQAWGLSGAARAEVEDEVSASQEAEIAA